MKNFKLSKELFVRKSIICARSRFLDLAEITITECGGYYNLQILNSRWDEKTTMREFENYVIDLMNSWEEAL